nr:reverse transcriptase domain-containing protein [Tanacetum cinerariifolium]
MAYRTMKELLQAPTEGYGEAIVIPEILMENFEITTNLLQLVQSNKFHGRENENPHTHISNFKRMTATLKYRDVSNDAIKLMLFSYSLEEAARIWYEKKPPNLILTWDDLVNKYVNQFFHPSKTTHLKIEISRFTQRLEETFGEAWDRFKEMLRACPHHGFSKLTQIDTFYNGLNEQNQDSLNAAAGGNLLNKTTSEALKIIVNKSSVRYLRSKSNVSRVNTSSRDIVSKTNDRIDKLADQISNLVEIVNKQVLTPATAKAVEKTCVTCGGAHAYYDCIATDSNQPSVCAATGSYNQEEKLRRNLNDDMRSILSSFFQNQASTSGTLLSYIVPNPKGKMKAVTTRSDLAYEGPSIPTNSPLEKIVEQNIEEITDKEQSNCQGSTAQVQPSVVPISIPEPNVSRTQPKPTIPYPSRLNDQKLREKATNQMGKFFQIFHDLHFDISFADALLLMPKFASTIKSLLTNKDKLFELAKVPLNDNCSAMLLKKLPEKLGDPGKFLFPCDFPGMDVCHALADLGASINLMPLSIWKKLSLPELTPTRMTLELADMSITRPNGVAEDVFVKVGKFHFPTDFVVVDFKADPRVPLILGRSFLRTGRALINVCGEEITLGVNDKSVTFNLNQIMRYSLTYDDNFVNRVNVINIACEEFVQDNPKSSNPTLVSESECCKKPIVKSSSLILTPFRERDILYLENLLNKDPFQFLPMNLKQAKSPIEEPEYSLSMGYEHLSTILKIESDEVIKSSAKNLLPIPSKYEVTLDDESECDFPVKDDFSPGFTTFSNPLFDDNDDFTSSDDESISNKDVLIEEFKVYSNPLFDDEEINSNEINPHCFNAESDFVESLSNSDTLIDSSPRFDYLEEFSGVLMPTSIADEERIRREHEEYISLMGKLLAINSCPRPLENFHANTIIKTLPTSLIPVEDSDSQREEIDILTSTDELLPPSIESDDDNSEGDIHFLEELLVYNSIPENESSNFDHQDDPSFPRPPSEPPDVEFFFDLEPNSEEVISAVINNNDELNEDNCFDPGGEINVFTNVEDDDYSAFIFVIRIFLPCLIYPEVSPLLLSAGSEDTIFDPDISV